MKRRRVRKLSEENAAAIQRKADLLQGTNESFELDRIVVKPRPAERKQVAPPKA